ncbi:MAG: hypothetical protein MUE44_09860 [Oscillatoriaceae cyanobacterium Prado104]|jgi:hypothetical protein|nr:hypothetical protein [Oscillatoriaceae cyanobacterium Prado104]
MSSTLPPRETLNVEFKSDLRKLSDRSHRSNLGSRCMAIANIFTRNIELSIELYLVYAARTLPLLNR